ncbi:protein SCARECROW 1-like [Canna indica]|uniref:Protein SCARECROW 1-like n=1 Tax=Canna indica TaxID=4628 RepID=A0AAQ3KAS0_9LILI|nr:protein SCARECROW 1-like [Canna indica]
MQTAKPMMMREDHLHLHDALDILQPSEHWPGHHHPILLPYQTPLSFPQQMLDTSYSIPEQPELAELVPQLPFGAALEIDAVLTDSSTSTGCFALEHRPRKVARRDVDHGSGTSSLERQDDDHGVSMIALLLECALAISSENMTEANRMLHELTYAASPYSPSCAERVVAYFTKGMASRVINSWTGICAPLIPHDAILSSFETFNNISPFIKFAHFTANQAILEAFHQRDLIHIVDLDIMQGLQWPALLHIFATRAGGPPHLRMTAFGASAAALAEIGKRLSDFARRLGMPFEFRPMAKRPGEVHPSMVSRRKGEGLAVHWLQHTLYDSVGSNSNAMRLIELLRPKVVTLVEQEIGHCGGSFLDRFMGSLHYYCVMFDSLGASIRCDDPSRHKVEHGILGREIENILAVGGPGRSGEQKFESWRAEMARRGFAQVSMSRNAMAQAQLILNLFPSSLGYTILHGDGTVKLGWKETGLYTVSSWTAEPLIV